VLRLDHITVAANAIDEGVAHVERALGISIPVGGSHPLMGTHNHLLRLGETSFLEVIAPDPKSEALIRPRWFSLDDPKMQKKLSSSPRLVTWIAYATDIRAALADIPQAAGPAITVTRGGLKWLISVPPDGSMPLDGAFPTLIEWPSGPHPASRMAELGCSLVELEIRHPESKTIQSSLKTFLHDPRIRFCADPVPSLNAVIRTPHGERKLS
jgi:hypothetical protein